MKQLRLLGFTLVAILALGIVAAASASATERGVLLLKGEEGTVEIKGPEKAVTGSLTAEGKTITCTKVSLAKVVLTEPGPTHFNLGKDGEIDFFGCKQGANACASVNAKGEKDPKETILLLADVHLVNLEGAKGELLPGIAVLVLGTPTDNKTPPLKLVCGVLNIEVKGAAFGLVTPLTSKGEVAAVGEDVEDVDINFVAAAVKCDKTEEKVCQEIQEKEPLLAKIGEKFLPATEESTLFLVTPSKMVVVDF